MSPILLHDIFSIILEFLQHDPGTLFSFILVNRALSMLTIPILWKNPFIYTYSFDQLSNYQLALLFRTYLSCFSDEERNYLAKKGVNTPKYQKPLFNYASLLK